VLLLIDSHPYLYSVARDPVPINVRWLTGNPQETEWKQNICNKYMIVPQSRGSTRLSEMHGWEIIFPPLFEPSSFTENREPFIIASLTSMTWFSAVDSRDICSGQINISFLCELTLPGAIFLLHFTQPEITSQIISLPLFHCLFHKSYYSNCCPYLGLCLWSWSVCVLHSHIILRTVCSALKMISNDEAFTELRKTKRKKIPRF